MTESALPELMNNRKGWLVTARNLVMHRRAAAVSA